MSSEANYDTANPAYIRKYLRTYGLTPPRAESYEAQKTRCMTETRLMTKLTDRPLPIGAQAHCHR